MKQCYSIPFAFLISLFAMQNGWADQFTNSIGQTFVYVEAGSFIMGSSPKEDERGRDERRHKVTITRPFLIMTTEVTQAQWQKVMGDNPSYFTNCDACPVERVSWVDALNFIDKLNKLEQTDSYALPTEAQWEYAARAGSRGSWPQPDEKPTFGLGCVTVERLSLLGWYCSNSESRTHPVAMKAPNGLGLFDMHGNVWEWTMDWYGPYPDGETADPQGPKSGTVRVLRGGSWFDRPQECRVANRFTSIDLDRNVHMGFRLVKQPVELESD